VDGRLASSPHRRQQQLQTLLVGLDLTGTQVFVEDLFKMRRQAIGGDLDKTLAKVKIWAMEASPFNRSEAQEIP